MDFWDFFWLLMIYVPLIMVWTFALVDIFRRDDMSGWGKAVWVLGVVLLPFFGTFLYLIFRRPGATPQERIAIDDANRDFVERYSPTTTASQLQVLADLHDRGKLSDVEFQAEKARLLGAEPATPVIT